MMAYWDWWIGALALGAITFFYHQLVGRRFGVSSAWERVMHWKSERDAERIDQAIADEPSSFEAALLAATAAEFGTSFGTDAMREAGDDAASDGTGAVAVAAPSHASASVDATAPPRLPMTANLTLLVMIGVGAFAAALINGRFSLVADMGPAFSDIVVDGPLMWPTLFVGGILVGIGTRMAGGCSSGHGMSGCSRLQPVSLLATSVFFGTAVGVSSLLLWVI